MEIKIKQLSRIDGIDGVVVNSNSDEMLEIAQKLGAKTVKRDEYYASHSIKEFMWLNNNPINYSLAKMPRSQDLPNIQALNFAMSISSKKNIIENRNIVGKKPFIFEISAIEATDIDNEIDFEFAEYMYRKYRM